MHKLIYFPSFSVGSFSGGLQKDFRIKDTIPIRFYNNEYKQYQHPYFLVTGGHFYKKNNIRSLFGLDDNVLLMGDSGGYQIAMGTIKYDRNTLATIFNWLENNSDIAINLDIPPRGEYENKFQECLELSFNNFKYFYENQTGKTKFLSVLQGQTKEQFKEWYKMSSTFPFQGWCIGGIAGSIYKMISGLTVLIQNKEHLKEHNKYFHILGTSKIADFAILSQLQKSLNDINADITVTTDSSTPSRQVVYGCLHINPEFKRMNYNMVHMPKKPDYVPSKKLSWIGYSDIDVLLEKVIGFEELFLYNNDSYNSMVLHNLYVFIKAIETINIYIENRNELAKNYTMFPSDIEKLLDIMDEIVKAENPDFVFEKYSPFLVSLSRIYDGVDDVEEKSKEFFVF